jgi:hypothetical protein
MLLVIFIPKRLSIIESLTGKRAPGTDRRSVLRRIHLSGAPLPAGRENVWCQLMNTTHSSTPSAEVPGYAELQREMHDALRAQHPEWVQPNGDSPICDAYELRFEELLSLSLQSERARAHDACQAWRGKKHGLSQNTLLGATLGE